jgi:hypothetical protein
MVVDTLMMPRELLDRVKGTASRYTGVPTQNMMISATHTHSAPAVMGALGTDVNTQYVPFFEVQPVKAIEGAVRHLAPARAGWTVVQDFDHTHNRRWILRPDRIRQGPFGEWSIRANMHPGYQNPDFLGPSGPVDPSVIRKEYMSYEVRTRDGCALSGLLADQDASGITLVDADYPKRAYRDPRFPLCWKGCWRS